MKLWMTLVCAATLAACSPDGSSHDGHDINMSQSETQVMISNARVMPPFPGKDTAAAYFELKNMGKDNRLVSVASPISEAVEIHNHIEENGIMKMRRVDGVDVASGATVAFKPGSYHIMMFKADVPETLEDVALTLTYANGESVTVIAPIEGRGKAEDHSGH